MLLQILAQLRNELLPIAAFQWIVGISSPGFHLPRSRSYRTEGTLSGCALQQLDVIAPRSTTGAPAYADLIAVRLTPLPEDLRINPWPVRLQVDRLATQRTRFQTFFCAALDQLLRRRLLGQSSVGYRTQSYRPPALIPQRLLTPLL